MAAALLKILALAPGLLLVALLVAKHGTEQSSLNVTLNMLPLALLIVVDALTRRQRHVLDATIQASFYVYVFGVLRHTIFLVPFTDILSSVADSRWLPDTVSRVQTHLQWGGLRSLGINLTPFRKFSIYNPLHIQVIGNLALLFPLGIYIPILLRKARAFRHVLMIALAAAFSIELGQLVFTVASPRYHRSFDVDDIILNTAGACLGYLIYRLGRVAVSRMSVLRGPGSEGTP